MYRFLLITMFCFPGLMAQGSRVHVTGNAGYMNLWNGPGTQYDVVGRIEKDEVVKWLSTAPNHHWHYVQTGNGTKGYVNHAGVSVDHTEQVNFEIGGEGDGEKPVASVSPRFKFTKDQVLKNRYNRALNSSYAQGGDGNYADDLWKAVDEYDSYSMHGMLGTVAFDGVEYDRHSQTIWRLLHWYGDKRFAAELLKMPLRPRSRIGAHLTNQTFDTDEYLKTYFPITHGLAL